MGPFRLLGNCVEYEGQRGAVGHADGVHYPSFFGLPPKLGYIGSCCGIDEIPAFVTIAVYNEFRNFASPSEG